MVSTHERVEGGTQGRSRSLPGDVGFWTFIAADAMLFALLFYQFSLDRSSDAALYESGQRTLIVPLATINTLVLITSSWCAAMAVRGLHLGQRKQASLYAFAATSLGVVSAVIKVIEYVREIDDGHTVATSSFFMYYFIITGIHLGHLLVGMVAMVVAGVRLRSATARPSDQPVVESIVSYWHLVDVLWLFIFPLLYLAR
jgi:nitric oxide reductase NorE protein